MTFQGMMPRVGSDVVRFLIGIDHVDVVGSKRSDDLAIRGTAWT